MRDLGHGQVALLQKPGGGVHPQPAQIAGHRHAVQRLEADLQRALGQVKFCGQLGQGDAAALVGQQIIVRLAGVLQLQTVKVGRAGRVGPGIAADQLVPVFQRGGGHAGVIHDAAVFFDLAAAGSAGHGGAVAAAAHHRIDGVRHGNDARPRRDVMPRQPVRVAAAIPPLMVMAHQYGNFFKIVDFAQDFIPGHGMAAHFLPFGPGQRPGLAQDGIRHGDLADVVQVGGHVDAGRLVLVQAEGGGEHKHHVRHPVRMTGCVGIARVQGGDDALDQVMILHQMACVVQRGVRLLRLVCHGPRLLSVMGSPKVSIL